VMERSPSAFASMGEEDIRQHFLVQLNGQFEGAWRKDLAPALQTGGIPRAIAHYRSFFRPPICQNLGAAATTASLREVHRSGLHRAHHGKAVTVGVELEVSTCFLADGVWSVGSVYDASALNHLLSTATGRGARRFGRPRGREGGRQVRESVRRDPGPNEDELEHTQIRPPITLECARKIGDIMKYVSPTEKPQVSYSFYM
jgi:hypothetical protein